MEWNKFVFLLFTVFLWGTAESQETYNNCANALTLCPGKTFVVDNIKANATLCPGCEDDFTFCFSGENTIWMTFTTNENGGTVQANFSNLVFENQPGQGTAIQAAIIQATIPCVSASYSLLSTCQNNGNSSFILTANGLPPKTTYYIVVNGKKGTTDFAEATFDVMLDGNGIERNPQFYIGTNTTTICKGNTVQFYGHTQFCADQSVFSWFVNGKLIGKTKDSTFIYSHLKDKDVVTAKVACFTQCRDTLISNSISFTVHDFLVDAGADVTIQEGESIRLQGETTEDSILWEPSIYMSNPTIINPLVNPSSTTTYFLSGSNGTCSIVDEVTVFVEKGLKIPNTFTPNGDGINDKWEILGIEDFPDCGIQVFSRWGQIVFQTNGYSIEKRWDGTSKSGKKLASGAYFYVINLRDKNHKEPLQGTVTIVR